MAEIVLIGGGGHCKSVIDVIEQEGSFQIAGIVDKPKFYGSKILGYPVIGSDLDLKNLAKKYRNAIITVGQIKSPLIRIKLYELANDSGFFLPSIISPKAYMSKHSKIGNGSVIMHNSMVNANVSIGDNCIINSNALIEHDCFISSHCHISTNAIVNGNVKIESNCFIGSSATIKESIKIKKNSFIKAGSFVK